MWAAFLPVDVQGMNPEVDRQLQDAPPRTYYAHAAGRLIDLVRRIRGKYPTYTISLKSLLTASLLVIVASLSHAGTGLFMKNSLQLPTMRTHCIGRYLIDLPEEYELTPGSELTLYYGLDKDFESVRVMLPRQKGNQPQFMQLLNKEVGALKSGHHFKSANKNMLASVQEIDKQMALVQSYSSSRQMESLRLHLYTEKEGAIVRLEDFKYSQDPRTAEHVENQLIRIAQNTRFAPTPEKAGPGTCLGTAVIDAKQDGEVFILAFKSERHPDAIISIDMSSLPEKGDGGLLQRVAGKAGLLRMLDFSSTTLRKGKRQIAGRAGEELLDAGKEGGKVQRHFVAETLVTEPSSMNRPVIAISLSMGGLKDKNTDYLDPSLSEKESLAWWDAIVGSIRAR